MNNWPISDIVKSFLLNWDKMNELRLRLRVHIQRDTRVESAISWFYDQQIASNKNYAGGRWTSTEKQVEEN